MIIIIGVMDKRMIDFIKNHKFHDKIITAYKICNIKQNVCLKNMCNKIIHRTEKFFEMCKKCL